MPGLVKGVKLEWGQNPRALKWDEETIPFSSPFRFSGVHRGTGTG